jgi:fructokinase
MRMIDVAAIGELLIDFTPAGHPGQPRPCFEQNPGGAPSNVLACVSKLGHRAALIGKVGDDQFGVFLKNELEKTGVSTQGLVFTKVCLTTLDFVHLDENGDRTFTFYRHPGADLLLEVADVDVNIIKDCRIFHFGSVSLTDDPAREATLWAARKAKSLNKLISYDPNLRPMLWSNLDEARPVILNAMALADIVKISEEELLFLTGKNDLSQGAAELMAEYDLQLVMITLGAKGAYARSRAGEAYRPAYDVKTVDTTGAGDAFTGAILHQLLVSGHPAADLTHGQLAAFLSFANAAGSLTTMKKGAIPGLPTLAEILECQASCPELHVNGGGE